MCLASGRPLQWGAVSQSEVAPERWKEQLAFLERANRAGASMYAQTASNPPSPVFELAEYNGFDAMPNWIDPFVGTPEERMAKLRKPEVRDLLVPSVPTPMAGAVYILPPERVHPVDVPFTAALRVFTKWGAGSSEFVQAMEAANKR
jgi:hypothetical protein